MRSLLHLFHGRFHGRPLQLSYVRAALCSTSNLSIRALLVSTVNHDVWLDMTLLVGIALHVIIFEH